MPAKGWKTVVYGILLGVIALISATNSDFYNFLSAHVSGFAGIASVITIVLRAVTDSSIFKSTPPTP